MNINVVYDASAASAPAWYTSAVASVVNLYDALIANPVNITFQVGWGEQNSKPIYANTAAQNTPVASGLSYADLKAALARSATTATDNSFVATLGPTDPTNGGTFYVPMAMQKALGLTNPGGTEVDGFVGLSSALPWQFTTSGPVDATHYDPIATLNHEFSELLGRVGIATQGHPNLYGPMDLFRYSAPGQRQMGPGAASFSLDGRTLQQPMNDTTTGRDAADWAPSVQGDMFGGAFAGVTPTMSGEDMQILDALGYTVTPPAPNVSIDPTVALAPGATAIILSGQVSDPTATVDIVGAGGALGTASVGADGSWTFAADLAAAGTAIAAVATTSDGRTASSGAPFVLRTQAPGAPYAVTEQIFDAGGHVTGETLFNADGSIYLSGSVSTRANGNTLADCTAGSRLANGHLQWLKDLYSPTGTFLREAALTNGNTHLLTDPRPGTLIESQHNDVMTGGGGGVTFDVAASAGHETITDFALGGPHHDWIGLSASQFADVAHVLQNTQDVGGNAVITLAPKNTITLQGVSADMLKAHQGDIWLH